MKKFLIAIAATLTLTLTSCGGADLKSIDEKFDKGDKNTTFTQDEYETMVSYLEELSNDPETMQKLIESENTDKEVVNRVGNYTLALGIAQYDGSLDASILERWKKVFEKIIPKFENQ